MAFQPAISRVQHAAPGNFFHNPTLPDHCQPQNAFLTHFSSIFHTCIPTPLALLSTVLGCLSILSWLFAQLPQIIKNYKLQSTAGLSIYFLTEWLLGDMSNLFGAILTNQATWQIIIGAYYCFVDLALVAQWAWYEGLAQGSGAQRAWPESRGSEGEEGGGAMQQVLGGVDPTWDLQTAEGPRPIPRDIRRSKDDMFHSPDYGSFGVLKEFLPSLSNGSRRLYRAQSNPIPSPSPKTVLLLSMMICMASTSVSASPITPSPGHSKHTFILPLGTVLSWTSTVLYLVSRMPQLLKNFRLRSTAGLSPLLFAAAFCGNLFYSSSLLTNPNLWYDAEPYGSRGWAGADGNERSKWMFNSLPFFLGAAVVLVMDAGMGVQFWLWGEAEVVACVEGEALRLNDTSKRHWRRVNGWMRGWVPAVRSSRPPFSEDERRSLLATTEP